MSSSTLEASYVSVINSDLSVEQRSLSAAAVTDA